MTLVLHCIANIFVCYVDHHWSFEYLMDAKEVLIMIPMTVEHDVTTVVAVIYREGDGNV